VTLNRPRAVKEKMLAILAPQSDFTEILQRHFSNNGLQMISVGGNPGAVGCDAPLPFEAISFGFPVDEMKRYGRECSFLLEMTLSSKHGFSLSYFRRTAASDARCLHGGLDFQIASPTMAFIDIRVTSIMRRSVVEYKLVVAYLRAVGHVAELRAIAENTQTLFRPEDA
jgi:hypothetical protein